MTTLEKADAFGALLTGRLSSELADLDSSIDTAELLSTPEEIKALEPALRIAVEDAVAVATHDIFLVSLPIMAILLVASWFLPELELRTTTALSAQSQETVPPKR